MSLGIRASFYCDSNASERSFFFFLTFVVACIQRLTSLLAAISTNRPVPSYYFYNGNQILHKIFLVQGIYSDQFTPLVIIL